MKMCEQILQKRAPKYNSNSLNGKKSHEKANNSPSYCFAAINKTKKLTKTKCDVSTWYRFECDFQKCPQITFNRIKVMKLKLRLEKAILKVMK